MKETCKKSMRETLGDTLTNRILLHFGKSRGYPLNTYVVKYSGENRFYITNPLICIMVERGDINTEDEFAFNTQDSFCVELCGELRNTDRCAIDKAILKSKDFFQKGNWVLLSSGSTEGENSVTVSKVIPVDTGIVDDKNSVSIITRDKPDLTEKEIFILCMDLLI